VQGTHMNSAHIRAVNLCTRQAPGAKLPATSMMAIYKPVSVQLSYGDDVVAAAAR